MEFLRSIAAWFRPTPAMAGEIAAPKAPGKVGAWLSICVVAVAGFEGLYTHAYKDPVGIVTICYGVTKVDRPVKMGDTATVAECKQWLAEDLVRYNAMVHRVIKVSMPPHREAALTSFVYNVGEGNLKKSSVARYLNAGQVQKGCDALMLWNKAGGNVLKGLTTRRAAERKDCLRSD